VIVPDPDNSAESARGRQRSELLTLLIAALLMLVGWSVLVPVFETPDEPHHWQYARYLHDHARLPAYGPGFVEANSPPLYYALVAPVAVATELPPPLAALSESGQLELPFAPRYYENTADALWHYWPIRFGRLLTVCMSILTIVFCYKAAIDASGHVASGLLCAGLVAFLPEFTFRGMSLSNDALVTTMSAGATWMLVRIVRAGFTWPRGVICGVFVALAYLSKISAICLAVPLALALATERVAWLRRGVRLAVFAPAAAIVAPWTARNMYLYGDPFASAAMHTAVANIVDVKPLTSEYFYTTFPHYLSRSFVGMFGWMNIMLPEWLYGFYWLLGGLAASGLLWSWRKRALDIRLVVTLASILAINLLVVVHINRTFTQPQGRYLFPALPALALLVTAGLEGLPLWPSRRTQLGRAVVWTMAAANILIVFTVVYPAYYPPVAPFVSRAAAALTPDRLYGLNRSSDGTLRISNADPQIVIDTHLAAAVYGFLEFQVEGIATDPAEVGSVFFSVDGQPLTEAQRVDFQWRADGRRHLIKVPLLKHPRWSGTITTVRIDPVNAALEKNQSTVIRVGAVEATGTF
jgi:hypothetical protein